MTKSKDTYNKYKSEVIVSVITAFICFLGKTILVYLKDTGSKFVDVFGNYIYYQMARIDNLALLEFFASFILGVFAAFCFFEFIFFIFISNRKTKENIKKISLPIVRNNYFRTITSILGCLSIVFVIFYSFCIIYCLDCKRSFDLKMTTLKPYITQEKYDLLYSEWVTMYGKKDYKRIQKELFNLRCEYLIKNEDIKNAICK